MGERNVPDIEPVAVTHRPRGSHLLRSIAGDYAIRAWKEVEPAIKRECRRREREIDRLAGIIEAYEAIQEEGT